MKRDTALPRLSPPPPVEPVAVTALPRRSREKKSESPEPPEVTALHAALAGMDKARERAERQFAREQRKLDRQRKGPDHNTRSVPRQRLALLDMLQDRELRRALGEPERHIEPPADGLFDVVEKVRKRAVWAYWKEAKRRRKARAQS